MKNLSLGKNNTRNGIMNKLTASMAALNLGPNTSDGRLRRTARKTRRRHSRKN